MLTSNLLSRLTRTLAVAALALGLHVAPATAATYNIGTLSATPYLNFAVLPTGAFLDIYNFNVSSPAEVGASAVSLDLLLQSLDLLHISNLTLSLYNGSNDWLGNWGGSPLNLEATLAAGAYHVNVSGTADGISGGAYLFSIAAIPEPEQWMLLAAGFGLLGMMVRRRRTRV